MPLIFGEQVAYNQRHMETVIHLIAKSLGSNRVRIKPTTPLLSVRKVFDSYRLMEFILRLEDTFGISIPNEDLDPDIFHSPRTIVKYLHSRLEQDA